MDTLAKLDFHIFLQDDDYEHLVSPPAFVRRIGDLLNDYIYSRGVSNNTELFANLNYLKDIGRQIRRAARKNNNNQIVLSATRLFWKSSASDSMSNANFLKFSAVLHILHEKSGGNFKLTNFFDENTANKTTARLSNNDDRDPVCPRLFHKQDFAHQEIPYSCLLFNTLIFSDLYEIIDNKFLLEHQENIKRWGREFQEVETVLPPQFDMFFSHFHYVLTQEHAAKNTAGNGMKKKLRV